MYSPSKENCSSCVNVSRSYSLDVSQSYSRKSKKIHLSVQCLLFILHVAFFLFRALCLMWNGIRGCLETFPLDVTKPAEFRTDFIQEISPG